MTITLGALRVLSVRLLHPWRGAWIADVDVDPDDAADAPTSGPVVLTIGTQTLAGTVDPRASGRFVSTVRIRVVAGGGGWDHSVREQMFHSDAGISSTRVYQTTASLVGETVNDVTPITLGFDFARSAGPASRVFGDRDWWVGLDGVTVPTTRPTATPDDSLEVLSFDPHAQRLELACDVVVVPGTVITDARFDGSLTVRSVEQTFDPDRGARAFAYCSSANVERLMAALTTLVRELGRTTYLKTFRYRVVSQAADGRLTLQAVDKPQGMPDGGPITVWPGMAGASAKYKPAQLVRVAFFDGDPTLPVVVGADGTLPLEASLNASTAVHLGGGGAAVARIGDTVSVIFPPEMPFVGTVGGAPATGTLTIASPGVGIIQTGSQKVDSG